MSEVTRIDNRMEHLYPAFAALVKATLAQANHECAGKFSGFSHWALFEGYRSRERQLWLYGQGRPHVKPYGREGTRVTNMKTPRYHGVGLAADIVWYGASGQSHWDGSARLWAILGHCARSQGLKWGGDWPKLRDLPHVQPVDYDIKAWTPKARDFLTRLGLSVP